MINFWKLSYKLVKEQRDQQKAELLQCKAENEKLRERNKELEKRCNQKLRRYVRGGLQQSKIVDLESKCDGMKTENEQLKAERESMISDYQKKLDLVHMLKDEINEFKQENERKDKLIEALKASESNLWHSSREFEEENEEYRKESEQLKIKNEYLLNVIKMSENIEIHSDAYDEMEKGENNKTYHIPHLTDIKTNESIEEPMKFIKRIAKERADDER